MKNMENLCKNIVKKLTKEEKTIAFMESCTGGFLSSKITDIEGSSSVLKVGIVSYSNEYKIKFGVSKEVIDEYSVYSIETAKEMALSISKLANADVGVGITGELAENSTNTVYYAIYFKENNKYITNKIIAKGIARDEKKKNVAKNVLESIYENI